MKQKERVETHIRLPRDIYLKLVARAAENHRTVNGELCILLRRLFEDYRR